MESKRVHKLVRPAAAVPNKSYTHVLEIAQAEALRLYAEANGYSISACVRVSILEFLKARA